MFRKKHLIWIPQEHRSPLPCLFVGPPKKQGKKLRKHKRARSSSSDNIPLPPPIPDALDKLHVYVVCFEYTGFGFALNKGEQTTPTETSTQ